MSSEAHREIIAAATRERLDLFLAAANRLGAAVGSVEKDLAAALSQSAARAKSPAALASAVPNASEIVRHHACCCLPPCFLGFGAGLP